MAMTDSQEIPAPPRLIPALLAGFDAITNHILVILFPIIFDILIWFAPHLRLKNLIENLIGEMVLLSENEGAELAGMIDVGKDVWLDLSEQINLAIALRSYPVGIPSLMASSLPLETPFGIPVMIEISSLEFALFTIVILIGLGLILGTLYYQLVSQVAMSGDIRWEKIFRDLPRTSLQVILLALIWLGLFLLVSIPASCLVSVAALAGFSIGQFAILLYGGFLIWLLFPLLFSAHGIFVKKLSVWPSIRLGIRITNATLPTTVLFFLSVFVLTQGLDILWRIPPADSWLSVLGIAGHGFVVTGILSASFIYYRDADRWVTSVSNQLQSTEKSQLEK